MPSSLFLRVCLTSTSTIKLVKLIFTLLIDLNDAQRQATKDAGTIAGLGSPYHQAAIAYCLNKKASKFPDHCIPPRRRYIQSLLSIDAGVFETLATAGDTLLEDFDNRVINYLVKTY